MLGPSWAPHGGRIGPQTASKLYIKSMLFVEPSWTVLEPIMCASWRLRNNEPNLALALVAKAVTHFRMVERTKIALLMQIGLPLMLEA